MQFPLFLSLRWFNGRVKVLHGAYKLRLKLLLMALIYSCVYVYTKRNDIPKYY